MPVHYQLLDISTNRYTRHFLRDAYILTNGASPHVYGCTPNGEIGISIILNGAGYILVGDRWELQPPVSVYGLVRQVQFHKMSPGYKEVNIGFRPEYLQLFLRDRVSALEQRQATDLYQLVAHEAIDQLVSRLHASAGNEDIPDIIGSYLATQMRQEAVDERIAWCLRGIRAGDATNVGEMARYLGVSSTTLRQQFQQHVGISPKELIRIHRVKRALNRRDMTDETLTRVAYELGYYDQSHFIHDFREAIGITPGQYFANEKLTFDFYNFQRWSYDSFAGITI